MTPESSITLSAERKENRDSPFLLAAQKVTDTPPAGEEVKVYEEEVGNGQKLRRIEAESKDAYIRVVSVKGPDPTLLPGVEAETFTMTARVPGLGSMDCTLLNGRIDVVSYVDAIDATKVWRDVDTPECREYAKLVLDMVVNELYPDVD
jgi:hypothetical protein